MNKMLLLTGNKPFALSLTRILSPATIRPTSNLSQVDSPNISVLLDIENKGDIEKCLWTLREELESVAPLIVVGYEPRKDFLGNYPIFKENGYGYLQKPISLISLVRTVKNISCVKDEKDFFLLGYHYKKIANYLHSQFSPLSLLYTDLKDLCQSKRYSADDFTKITERTKKCINLVVQTKGDVAKMSSWLAADSELKGDMQIFCKKFFNRNSNINKILHKLICLYQQSKDKEDITPELNFVYLQFSQWLDKFIIAKRNLEKLVNQRTI